MSGIEDISKTAAPLQDNAAVIFTYFYSYKYLSV